MVLLWDSIEWWDGDSWESVSAASGFNWLNETNEELNGDEYFTFTMPNNVGNRVFVGADRDVRLKYNGEVIFTGVLNGVEYSKRYLKCIVYNNVYEKLKRSIITDVFIGQPANEILEAICLAASVTAGDCPTTELSIRFKRTECFAAARFLAYILGVDFWSDGDTLNLSIRDRCIVALPINEGSGSVLEDKSGFGVNATIVGATWSGGELTFDGNDYISVPTSDELDALGEADSEYSVIVTFKSTIKADQSISEKWPSTKYPFGIRGPNTSNGNVYATLYDGTNNPNVVISEDLADGELHNVIFTVKRGVRLRIYHNGILSQETADTTSGDVISVGAFAIGARNVTPQYGFTGTIKNFMVILRELTADEAFFYATEKIKDAKPRGVDRSKLRDKVIVVGVDESNDEMIGIAGTGTKVEVFRETKPADQSTINALAAKKLAEINTIDSRINLQLFTKFCALLLPGDVISVHNDALALNSMYRIQKLAKGLRLIDCEIGRKQKTQAELLKELQAFEEMGIAVIPPLYASDTVRHENAALRETIELSYVKLKEIKVNESINGPIRIKFTAFTGGELTNWETSTFLIYRNGVAVGEERVVDGPDPVIFSEDFDVFTDENDLIQIYAKTTDTMEGEYPCGVYDMKICYDPPEVTLSFTNQDP